MESAKYTQRNKEMFKNEESRTNTTKTKTRQTQKCSPSGRIANGDASGDPNPDPGPVNGDSKGSPAQSDAPRKSSDRDKVKWRARERTGLETRRSAVRVRFDDELVRNKPCRALSSVGEKPPESWPRLMSNGESACGDGMGWALRCAPSPSPRSPGSLGASGIWRRPRTGFPVIIDPTGSGYGVSGSGSGRVVLGASRGDSPPFRAWMLRCDHVPGAGGTRRGSFGGVRGVWAIWSMGVMGWLVLPPDEWERRMKEAEARVYVGVKPQGELRGDVDVGGIRRGGIER